MASDLLAGISQGNWPDVGLLRREVLLGDWGESLQG